MKKAYFKQTSGDYTCDFENDLCGFIHDKTADFEWAQIYGETPSRGTGPDSDHTTGRLGILTVCLLLSFTVHELSFFSCFVLWKQHFQNSV